MGECEKLSLPDRYVAELNGYLLAISHLNDEVGWRHGFSAKCVELLGRNSLSVAKELVGDSNVTLEATDARGELSIIKRNVFRNFMFGNVVEDGVGFIKEQIVWHIQDYVSLVVGDEINDSKRWFCSVLSGEALEEFVFVENNDRLLMLVFRNKKEADKKGTEGSNFIQL